MFRFIITIVIAAVSITGLVACGSGTRSESKIDRHDPESVLQAYFDAWAQGDQAGKTSFLDKKYGRQMGEPVESISNIAIRGGSSGEKAHYSVSFDIVVRGHGVSMQTGHYDWTSELTWDQDSDSWLITNYGAG